MVFIPPRHEKICKQLVENILEAEGARFIAWRRVPTESTSLGPGAKITEPAIWQCFVQRHRDIALDAFERQLYVIRKVFQQHVLERGLHGCYFPSLSAKTIVYKGMLMPEQLPAYYPDLSSRRFKSALAMVHSRFSTNTFPEWSLAQPFRFLCHNGEINTLRGNINQMHAAEVMFRSERLVRIHANSFQSFVRGGVTLWHSTMSGTALLYWPLTPPFNDDAHPGSMGA